MTYQEATDYLFSQLPVFEHTGASAYKPGLERTLALSAAFGNPHRRLNRVIHVAGTNGKGSTCHTLAAMLQTHGYRVGLFTSPHLVDFRERIRVNGEMIPESEVIDFVERFRAMRADVAPSFFELTTILAFEYFASQNTDYNIIEVGLGGRLDSTNIVDPQLCVITNISLDHTDLLGDTPEKIAAEKAGIIKPGVPVVIGEAEGDVKRVFARIAREKDAPICFASDDNEILSAEPTAAGIRYATRSFGRFTGELSGSCQPKNMSTVLSAVRQLILSGAGLTAEDVSRGALSVGALTGLAGRWMTLGRQPLTICDTGHNPGGWTYLSEQLKTLPGRRHIIIGFVADKDVSQVLRLLADSGLDARFYFTAPRSHRRLAPGELQRLAAEAGIEGECCDTVVDAYKKSLAEAGKGDSIFIGGSNYLIGELLEARLF